MKILAFAILFALSTLAITSCTQDKLISKTVHLHNGYQSFNTSPHAQLIRGDVYNLAGFLKDADIDRPFGSSAKLNIKTGELKLHDTPQNIELITMIFETAVK